MSVLVVGVSHRTASLDLLERFAIQTEEASKLAASVLETSHVTEAVVLATCNRVEVYAEVDRFHGSVEAVTTLLAAQARRSVEELVPAIYVHYDEAAVAHLFTVAAGLDSMVVGEAQILGQVRETLRRGQSDETVGPALNALLQQGLRVGKRAHAETGIDRAGQSVISVALGAVELESGPVEGRRVLVIGAGSIAALAATTAHRAGAAEVVVMSRTLANARRLAATVSGRAAGMSELVTEMLDADVVICCTGASGAVVTVDDVARAVESREPARPLSFADLALPHDVDPAAAELPGVTVVDLHTVAAHGHEGAGSDQIAAARDIIADEVTAFTAARDQSRVTPTVVALRSMATTVVAAELERLWSRLDGLDEEQRAEIEHAVRRVADKLLHEPTVRVKQFAGRVPEASYAEALAELFALDPAAVEAVTRAGDKP